MMDIAVPVPGDDRLIRLLLYIAGEIFVRDKEDVAVGKAIDDLTAFEEVQQTSDSALTSAVVFT